MIELVLPYPCSSNRYWRTYMPRGFAHPVTTLSPEAKAFKAEVRIKVREAGIREPLPGRIRVEIELYPFRPQDWIKRAQRNPLTWDDDVRCIDLDNANKVLLDALKGLVFDDDRNVFELASKRCEPDGDGRVVVRVEQLVLAEVQPVLFGDIAA